MIYLDTSVLIAAHTIEPESDRALTWLAANSHEVLAISPWNLTEFASGLSRKVRTGKLLSEERDRTATAFAAFRHRTLEMLPLHPEHFESAAQMASIADTGLRASDALHLAIAAEAGCTLATFDKVFERAAHRFGVPIAKI
ncbi:hypothetical protein VE25_05325 [Devosia geojensis]|uniref:Ribonuclease VapC n=1 Tax=Devosia geojensis TaxID=443610 RepID=A0A0F5FV81_9HYPH|nr:type II toxin-antitoxin system VapC family toxin [Devosia geojensis]KKB12769.1 hypothetical protein VE25_05325 [Devosia geojensis]